MHREEHQGQTDRARVKQDGRVSHGRELGEQIVKPYQTSLQHLLAEIARIDVLIRRQVWWTRHTQGPEDEFRGLYISEREIDALVTPPPAQLDPQAASHLNRTTRHWYSRRPVLKHRAQVTKGTEAPWGAWFTRLGALSPMIHRWAVEGSRCDKVYESFVV